MAPLLIAALLTIQAGPEDSVAANWECATPLIEKNYRQQFNSEKLAARIADECTKPFLSNETDGLLQQLAKNLYLQQQLNFQLEIKAEIERRRRHEEIKLIR